MIPDDITTHFVVWQYGFCFHQRKLQWMLTFVGNHFGFYGRRGIVDALIISKWVSTSFINLIEARSFPGHWLCHFGGAVTNLDIN